MASPTQWTWVWVNSGSWWWTGRPGVLRFMGSQRVGHDWVTELNWTAEIIYSTAHAHHEVLTWSGQLCAVCLNNLHLEKPWRVVRLCCVMLCLLLRLLCQPGENKHICSSYRRRQWHPTPVLLPGESHGRGSLVGCSPWGCWSRTRLSDFTFTFHLHALEKEMATHSSVLAWRISGTGKPVGLPSMGSHRVGHDWSDLAAAAAVPTALQSLSSCLAYPGFSRQCRLFSVNSKTTGIRNRVSNTTGVVGRIPRG